MTGLFPDVDRGDKYQRARKCPQKQNGMGKTGASLNRACMENAARLKRACGFNFIDRGGNDD